MGNRVALITGITGQDGSYLAEYLLSKGYIVHGIVRRSSSFNTSRLDHIYIDPHDENAKLYLHNGDLVSSEQISGLIYNIKPTEIYNLAAQSQVRVSFDIPEYTGNTIALGTVRILDALYKSGSTAKFYNASTSEIFGSSPPPQSEDTPFQPRSPYAVAKLYSHYITNNYREAYGLFATNGILFNHESPRRGETFVTRKITMAIARILSGREKEIYMGNIEAKRDWGFAPEYVEAMWKILQQNKPLDFVIGTGETHSVREFLEESFSYVGLNWEKYVKYDSRYLRPSEVENLQSNPSLARQLLNWAPKIKFKDLVKIMVDADFKKEGITPVGEGERVISEKFSDKWWGKD